METFACSEGLEAAFSGVPTEVCFYIFDILLAVEFFYLQRMNGADALP